MNPTISLLDSAQAMRDRFRLDGGTLTPDWAASTDKPAWCEVSVYPDGFVGAYGGEVWPSAWPHLFRSVRDGFGNHRHYMVTDTFRALAPTI